jgi:SAM-dependent methyltransferase
MKAHTFSIITPEHDPANAPYLLELWHSILAQTYDQWQWVLYLNNGCTPEHIPDEIKNHPRVVCFWAFDRQENIGEIKHHAFHIGQGDILVEADHDDILLPECLARLNEAYQAPERGFVYSDNAQLHMAGEFHPYDPVFGWTWKEFDFRGKKIKAMNSFEPTSHALAYIWYAPDHVRSWRRDVYQAIGGHNVELDVCDDHELMIRTYLATEMYRIPEVLYIYRVTGNNTWLARNEKIQTRTRELCNQWARRLAEHDARRRGLSCVDIGGGLNPWPGYVTVDLRPTADYQADLNHGIPLPSNSVGVLNASHILEHLHDKTQIMREIHRVLAHGGWAFIDVPSTDGRGAFQDPTHVSYWNENSFLYYTDAYLANFIDNVDIRFQEFRRDTTFPNDWMRNLGVSVTTAWLTAVKDGPRLPGSLRI